MLSAVLCRDSSAISHARAQFPNPKKKKKADFLYLNRQKPGLANNTVLIREGCALFPWYNGQRIF